MADMTSIYRTRSSLGGVSHRNERGWERCSTAPLFPPQKDASVRARGSRASTSSGVRRGRSKNLDPLSNLDSIAAIQVTMQRNKLIRKSMGKTERGKSKAAIKHEELQQKLDAEAAAKAAEAARLAALPPLEFDPIVHGGVLPQLPAHAPSTFMEERPESRSEDFNGAARWRREVERPEREYLTAGTARRQFFESYAAHQMDMLEQPQLEDPQFAELSARRRQQRVDFIEDNFTARHRFMEECLQRKVGPMPVLLQFNSNPNAEELEEAGGVVVDLSNYRLGDHLAAALAESLRVCPDPVAKLLLPNNLLQGLPSEFQAMAETIKKVAQRGGHDRRRCGPL